MTLTLNKIRSAARAGRIRWRYHALVRAEQRGITRALALTVIRQGEIIEQRPRAKPFPKCLIMKKVEQDKPLYVSLGYDEAKDYLYIITVHWFDPRKWEDPWTRNPKRRDT
jgi:hypothetical protein